MKKLAKEQLQEREAILKALREAHADLAGKIETLNEATEAAWEGVDEAQRVLDEHIASANEFAQEMASAMEDYASDRSEKWTESEAGETYANWKSTWEDFSLDSLDIEKPEPLETPDDPADLFEELAISVEEA